MGSIKRHGLELGQDRGVDDFGHLKYQRDNYNMWNDLKQLPVSTISGMKAILSI